MGFITPIQPYQSFETRLRSIFNPTFYARCGDRWGAHFKDLISGTLSTSEGANIAYGSPGLILGSSAASMQCYGGTTGVVKFPSIAAINASDKLSGFLRFRPDAVGVNHTLLTKRKQDDSAFLWRLRVTTGNVLRFEDGPSGTNNLQGTLVFRLGGIYSIGWCVDPAGPTIILYIQDNMEKYGVVASLDINNDEVGSTLHIGETSSANTFKGSISDVALVVGLNWSSAQYAEAHEACSDTGPLTGRYVSLPLPPPADALQNKMVHHVLQGVQWARKRGLRYQIGEFEVPNDQDTALWNAAGELVLRMLDYLQVERLAWGVSEYQDDQNEMYWRTGGVPGILTTAKANAALWEAHPFTRDYGVGLSDQGPAVGTPAQGAFTEGATNGAGYRDTSPGTLNTNHGFLQAGSLTLINSRGIAGGGFNILRIALKWERLLGANGIGGNIVTGVGTYAQALLDLLDAAAAAGMVCQIEIHNNVYWQNVAGTATQRLMNGAVATQALFLDLWGKLITLIGTRRNVRLDMLNEPANGIWTTGAALESLMTAWITQVRTTSTCNLPIVLALGNYAKVLTQAQWHPGMPPLDPNNNAIYGGHFYGDTTLAHTLAAPGESIGGYVNTYATEKTRAEARGFTP